MTRREAAAWLALLPAYLALAIAVTVGYAVLVWIEDARQWYGGRAG